MIKKLFLNHPASVNESFFEHFRFALGFSFLLFKAGACALIHAFVPALHEKSASQLVARLYEKTHGRSDPQVNGRV